MDYLRVFFPVSHAMIFSSKTMSIFWFFILVIFQAIAVSADDLGNSIMLSDHTTANLIKEKNTEKSSSGSKKIYRSSLEEVTVFGRRDPAERFSIERSNTTLDLDAISERQPSNIFDLVKDVPGVNLNGGPRVDGTSISIRGMSNNEDLLVVIDGAVKNFEKYRFGQGLFLEPELLKTVSVSRGPATVMQGSGALGGVISMETKDASDLLRPGHDAGAITKLAYSDNNDEVLKSAAVYGRPTEKLDVLVTESRRDSNDIVMSNGETLALSSVSPKSKLAKFEWQEDLWLFGASASEVKQSGREFFDTTTNFVGVGGEVYRTTDDKTVTSYFDYRPDSEWLNVRLTYGDTDTKVDEESLTVAPGLVTIFDYDIEFFTANNQSFISTENGDWTVDIGSQYLNQDRHTDGSKSAEQQQPSGVTKNDAIYAQTVWELNGLSLMYGQRRDNNRATLNYQPSLEILQQYQQRSDVERHDRLENFRLSYQWERIPLELFAHKTDAIRPPKIDEYFTRGAFSRCLGIVYLPVYPQLPDPYQQSGMCGDLYQPEHADSREYGAVIDTPLFNNDDRLLVKWTHYKNDVSRILESLRTNPTAVTTQPGKEYFEGNELEFAYARGQWELDMTYAETDGKEYGYFVENSAEIVIDERLLYTIPGDLYAATLRWFSIDQQWEAGWRVAYRQAWTGFEFSNNLPILSKQGSSTEQQLFARYSPWVDTELRLTIDNITDESYRLPGGFAGSLGNYNQGRNVRLGWTQYFNF
jgi:hemoglobin/transferrin/lactoferrin receptor protein